MKYQRKLNTASLLRAFDDAGKATESMLSLVKKWGSNGLAKKAVELLEVIDKVRRQADRMLAKSIRPVQDYLVQCARKLEIEADAAHRAYLNSVNPHAFVKLSEAEEAAAFNKAKPGWVDNTGVLAYRPLADPPTAMRDWPSVNAYNTFHTMRPVTIPPGTTLYRIVDPTSRDSSICWMTEAEFKKLRSKDDWRRRFAVWANWNHNGEFVTYTVPPGAGLNVWEGITASQQMKRTNYVLEGGARQIVVDPAHMEKAHLGPRQKTGWGYDELGTTNSMVGVPVQRNNWD